MRSFVFVHGGGHGAWCWEPLISEIKARGAHAYAFDLPGHGSDSTPRETVTRQTYLSAARDHISKLSLDRFTLVGHSLAGILLSELAAEFQQVEEVVYLAALVLSPGERALDLIPESRRSSYHKMAEESEDYSLHWSFKQARLLFLSDFEEAAARSFYQKMTPQPFGPYLDPVKSLSFNCPLRYLVCDQDKALPPAACLEWAARLGCRIEHIDSGHDVMLSKTAELADLLLINAPVPL